MRLAAKIGIGVVSIALTCPGAQADPKSPWDELTARGSKFVQQQNMAAAEPLMQMALSEAKKSPANLLRLAKSNANLGWLYFRQGKYLQAEPYLRQVLAIAEKSHEAEVIQLGVGVVEALAFMDLQKGKYREAESLYTRLTGATISVPELNPIVKVGGLLGRSNVLSAEGRYADARQLLAQSQTEIARLTPPPLPQGKPRDVREFATMLRQAVIIGFVTAFKKRLSFDQQVAQGNLYLSEGSLDQAESCFRKAGDQFKTDFKREAPAIMFAYMGLGKTCLQRGKLSDAQDYFQKAKTLLERESVQERPFVEACQISIADIEARKGQCTEAQANLIAAKSSLEKNLGENTVPVSDCWLGLANVAKITGKTEEAEADYRKSLDIKEKLLGQDSDKLGPALNPLAELLDKQGKEDDARLLYARCIDAHEKRSLSGNVQACKAMVGQGNIEKKQGNVDKAELLYRNALSPLERNLQPSDPLLIDTYKNLGEIYIAQNKMPEAESVLRREVSGLDRLAKQDETLVAALNGLATATTAQQKWTEAEGTLARILTLVENNPSFQGKTSNSLKDYPEVLTKLGKDSQADRMSERLQSLGLKAGADTVDSTPKADSSGAATKTDSNH